MTPSHKRILVVDDAPTALAIVERNLVPRGYTVFTASGVEEALKVLASTSIDLVITDYKMPRVSGLDLIRHVRENCFDTEVIMITGYASVKGAVEAVKMGAEEYLPKPFTDEELFSAVERAMKKQDLRRGAQGRRHQLDPNAYGIIGESKAIRKVFADIGKAAAYLAFMRGATIEPRVFA